MTDVTDRDRRMAKVAHLKPHQFKPGVCANPAGRPKGAQNKLTETFLEDAYAAWQQHGPQALDRLARDDPGTFAKVCASLMPKNVNLSMGVGDTLSELLERMNERRNFTHGVTHGDTIEDKVNIINGLNE